MLIQVWKKVLHMPAGRKAKLFRVILVEEGGAEHFFCDRLRQGFRG